jgi:hypothetical protein
VRERRRGCGGISDSRSGLLRVNITAEEILLDCAEPLLVLRPCLKLPNPSWTLGFSSR